jgi:hypothetical protein
MKKQGVCGAIVSILLTTAFWGAPASSALAQGCNEQLVKDFLSGWTSRLPSFFSVHPLRRFAPISYQIGGFRG